VFVSLRSVDEREGRRERGEWEGVGVVGPIRALMRFKSLGRGERGEDLGGGLLEEDERRATVRRQLERLESEWEGE